MHLPFLPANLIAIHRETDSLGLHDMQRLHISAHLELLALLLLVLGDEIREEIVAGKRRRNALAAADLNGVVFERWGCGARSGQRRVDADAGEI